MKYRNFGVCYCVMVLAAAFMISVTVTPVMAKDFPDCQSKINVEMATQKAEITAFKCYIETYRKKKVLWYQVGLKNISDTPARFLIRILKNEGSGFTGLIPQKGKPKKFPLLAPGKESMNKYPINTSFQIPEALTVVVEEAVE